MVFIVLPVFISGDINMIFWAVWSAYSGAEMEDISNF